MAQFLNGEFGPLDSRGSAFFRAAVRRRPPGIEAALEAALAAGKSVLADRYIASNLAHQGARVPREKRDEFLAWLKQLEYRGLCACRPRIW